MKFRFVTGVTGLSPRAQPQVLIKLFLVYLVTLTHLSPLELVEMTALAVLGDVISIATNLASRAYDTVIGTCLPSRRSPPSPTLSAQEGELDNLLSEPTRGWDDDDTISIAPRSIRYGKEGLLATRSPSTKPMVSRPRKDGGGEEADARELGEVNVETVKGQRGRGWEPEISLEELEREEEELAKMDPRVPDVEFGEFEEGHRG